MIKDVPRTGLRSLGSTSCAIDVHNSLKESEYTDDIQGSPKFYNGNQMYYSDPRNGGFNNNWHSFVNPTQYGSAQLSVPLTSANKFQELNILISNEINLTHLMRHRSKFNSSIQSARKEALVNIFFLHRAYYVLSAASFCKTVNLLDMYLRNKPNRENLLSVSAACYYIASKYDSTLAFNQPSPENLSHLLKCDLKADGLRGLVLSIVSTLTDKVATQLCASKSTPDHFLRVFADMLKAGQSDDNDLLYWLCCSIHVKRLIEVAMISTVDIFVSFRPSCIALAALYVELCVIAGHNQQMIDASMLLNHLQNIAYYCSLSWESVITCAYLLQNLPEPSAGVGGLLDSITKSPPHRSHPSTSAYKLPKHYKSPGRFSTAASIKSRRPMPSLLEESENG